MHKVHWGPVVVTAAAGLALSAIPSNSALGAVTETAIQQSINSNDGSELIHGLVFLVVVAAVLAFSRLHNKSNG